MTRLTLSCGMLATLFFAGGAPVWADEAAVDVRVAVAKGLDWLAKSQNSRDGHWEADGGRYPVAMTALAGMSFLMEGSTISSGKYSENIRKATDWFLKRAQPNGLLGNPNNPLEADRYMYGHGFGMLFLASVYGDEGDEKKQKELEKALSKAVLFCGKAQTDRGGWGYLTALEGGNFDEGSVTITQLQGLRAARNAGIHVPKSIIDTIIDKAVRYLHDCTTAHGGVIYSLAWGTNDERPALTAAAVACAFSAGEYSDNYAKKWLKYCKQNILFGKERLSHDEYQNYYFAQCVYVLGEDGYAKLFPEKKNPLRWSEFRRSLFPYLKHNQSPDGSWRQGGIGPVYSTAINLTILQLENGALPIYQP
jgi:hypothetical protein